MVAFFYKLLQHALLSDCRKDQFSSSSDNVTYSEILISIAIPSRRIKQHVLIGGIWSFPFVVEIFLFIFSYGGISFLRIRGKKEGLGLERLNKLLSGMMQNTPFFSLLVRLEKKIS